MFCRSEHSPQEENPKDPFPIMDDVVKMLEPISSEMGGTSSSVV